MATGNVKAALKAIAESLRQSRIDIALEQAQELVQNEPNNYQAWANPLGVARTDFSLHIILAVSSSLSLSTRRIDSARPRPSMSRPSP